MAEICTPTRASSPQRLPPTDHEDGTQEEGALDPAPGMSPLRLLPLIDSFDIDDHEESAMIQFFGARDVKDHVVTFEMFMRWWSKLHDSSADPDDYYSQERYRQRFKLRLYLKVQ